jgi:hypothetical protein
MGDAMLNKPMIEMRKRAAMPQQWCGITSELF